MFVPTPNPVMMRSVEKKYWPTLEKLLWEKEKLLNCQRKISNGYQTKTEKNTYHYLLTYTNVFTYSKFCIYDGQNQIYFWKLWREIGAKSPFLKYRARSLINHSQVDNNICFYSNLVFCGENFFYNNTPPPYWSPIILSPRINIWHQMAPNFIMIFRFVSALT